MDAMRIERAAAAGFETAYTGADGEHRQIDEAVLDKALAALPKRTPVSRASPPVSVAWDGKLALVLSVDVARVRGPFVLRVAGQRIAGELDALRVRSRRGATVDLVIQAQLPIGRFGAELSYGQTHEELTVLSAPRHAYEPDRELRELGVFAPLYSLRGERSLGIGDLGDLDSLIRGTHELGASFVGTLPLLAIFDSDNAGPYSPSPYSPASRLFFAERHLDLRATPEWERSRSAQQALDENDKILDALLAEPYVDHDKVARARRPILDALARTFFRSPEGRAAATSAQEDDRELLPYAQHRAKTETDACGWPAWEGGLPPPSDDAVRTHLYAQIRLKEQLKKLAGNAPGLGLYLDLPVGVHGDSFDCWRHPSLYLRELSVGAPPDPLAAKGQDWGFPPIDPVVSRATGHEYLYDVLRRHCEIAGVLRVDHIMGLHRMWVIPRGCGATEGVYLRMPADELWAILCLLSVEHKCLVVGEDLGTVPGAVREAMQSHRARRMFVGQFALTLDDEVFRAPPEGCVASINTHDTPAFATWLEGKDIDLYEQLGHLSEERAKEEREGRDLVTENLRRCLGDKVHEEFAVRLAGSDAELVQITLEDTWGETRPQNVPGTFREVPNFAGRMAHSVEDALALASTTIKRAAALRSTQRPDEGAEWRPWLDDDDHYLWCEGTHRRAHEKLGAHLVEEGAHFGVWAPSARSVSVVGDFNAWQPDRLHPSESGIWTGFLSGCVSGQNYKFVVEGEHGERTEKADPFAAACEEPPRTASVLRALDYAWADDVWMASRQERQSLDRPISIYEVHLGSWRRREDGTWLSYREAGEQLGDYARDMGFSHVELLPISEHPFYGSWGYQVTGFFAPSARYGEPTDFMAFVDALHARNVGVLLDWVPAHFPNDVHGLARFDGTALFEHDDPRLGLHPDWGTCIFNYGRHEVRSFLISSAMCWLDRFHIDGLRVDAVASMLYRDYSREAGEWIPNQYGGRENLEAVQLLQQLARAVHEDTPGALLIAEESTAWPGVTSPPDEGGLGFDLKWDMGWMHDTLEYMRRDPVHRAHHHNQLTFRAMYAQSEKFCLSLSHDEVVHGKGTLLTRMPGDDWQKFANLRLLFGYQWALPGKKLSFMGQELGAWREWDHDGSLDWANVNVGLQSWVRALNKTYAETPALSRRDFDAEGFSWIASDDAASSLLAFGRHTNDPKDDLVVVCNFTPLVREVRIGVAYAGAWRELLNSDDLAFGGSGIVNGPLRATAEPAHGRSYSVEVKLPPLGIAIFGRSAS